MKYINTRRVHTYLNAYIAKRLRRNLPSTQLNNKTYHTHKQISVVINMINPRLR